MPRGPAFVREVGVEAGAFVFALVRHPAGVAVTDQQALPTMLITGGAGFIGCAIAKLAAPRARRYVVVDSMHPQVHSSADRPEELHPAAELVVGDVTSDLVWSELLADLRPDIVVHLAAETGTGQSLSESTRHAHTNVVGTTQMLDAFTRTGHSPQRILLSSSRAVYGEGRWLDGQGKACFPGQRSHAQLEAGQWAMPGLTPRPSTAATTMPNPTSVYGATKLAQEHILSAWSYARSTVLDVLRLQNVYGPGQSLTNSYTGIVALFSRLARSGAVIPLYEDGLVTRDFVYIDDVAAAFVAALERPARQPRVLDIGSGVASTIEDMARALAEFYGAPAPKVSGLFRDGDVRHASCTVDAAERELGWRPSVDLATGVASLQHWIADVESTMPG